MKQIIFVGLITAVLVLTPVYETLAYQTTSQLAKRLSEESAVFVINYTLGGFNEKTYVPVFALRDVADSLNDTSLVYELLEDGKTPIKAGDTLGIVFADLPIEKGMYVLQPGQRKNFKLMVTLQTNSTTPEADYALHVTKLPFYHGEQWRKNALTKPELSYYITPEIELNAYEGRGPITKTSNTSNYAKSGLILSL